MRDKITLTLDIEGPMSKQYREIIVLEPDTVDSLITLFSRSKFRMDENELSTKIMPILANDVKEAIEKMEMLGHLRTMEDKLC